MVYLGAALPFAYTVSAKRICTEIADNCTMAGRCAGALGELGAALGDNDLMTIQGW